MDHVVPVIYVRAGEPARLPLIKRLFALLIALGCLTPLVLAANLPPSADGLGTHTQLGLAQCNWYRTTGLPCPSCGMTTSWAWFARGNLVASLYIQPMGTVLALIAAGCFWGGLYVAFTGRPIYRLLRLFPGRYYFLPLLGFAILAWGWKIFIHLTGHDGWV